MPESRPDPVENVSPLRLLAAFWLLAVLMVVLYSHEISSAVRMRVENESVAESLVTVMGILDRVSSNPGLKTLKALFRTVGDSVQHTPILVGSVPAFGSPAADIGSVDLLPAVGVVADEPEISLSPLEKLKDSPHRILLIGSSSMQFELGRSLERRLEACEEIQVLRLGRYSTGLARPDYFDWIEQAEELSESFLPDIVVAQMGGNDCQSLSDHEGMLVARFGTPGWDQLFSARLKQFIVTFQSRESDVVMLGLPIMRGSAFRKRVSHLNSIIETVALESSADFVSLWEMTENADGEYRSEIKLGGRIRALRADDGVHLSLYGSDYIAGQIAGFLQSRFGLTVSKRNESDPSSVGPN